LGNLIHNERVKYVASFFNNLAVASFAGGTIIPLFSQDERLKDHRWELLAVGILFAALFRFIVHRFLSKLKE
jgi:hypothetical protein